MSLRQDCSYLIKEKRTPHWDPDQDIQEKIDEKLRINEKFKGIIERLQKEAKDKQEPTAATTSERSLGSIPAQITPIHHPCI